MGMIQLVPKVHRTSSKGIELICKYEGFRSKPYKCPAGVPTIGFGTTLYPNGKKVSLRDAPINERLAIDFLKHDLMFAERQVDSFTRDDISQNQFDALVSFAYNLGAGALKKSTLLKKVNENRNNPDIKLEFMKWINAGGKPLEGLRRRRAEEASLYFA